MRDQHKSAFHYPSTRQHYELLRWQRLLPIDHHALVRPSLAPCPKQALGGALAWALHELHAPSELLLRPVVAPIISPAAGAHPQMFEAGKRHIRLPQ